MKKFVLPLIGGLLFIAGYYQARKQTAYMQSRVMQASPAYAKKPIILPARNTPALVFYLSRSFTKS